MNAGSWVLLGREMAAGTPKRLILLAAIMLVTGWRGSNPAESAPSFDAESVIRDQLRPILQSSGRSAGIYYSTEGCPSRREFMANRQFIDPVPFPEIAVRTPSHKSSVLATVMDIFRGNENVAVSEDASGMIRIRIGAPDALLQTRIPVLTLASEAQYNAPFAVDAIMGTKEMQLAMKRLHRLREAVPYAHIVAMPHEGLPHLPAEMHDVTADQALNAIAKTFGGGILIYGVCTRSGVFTTR